MKPLDRTIIGVRLIGVATLLVGLVCLGVGRVGRAPAPMLRSSTSGASDFHLHDTFYVVAHAPYQEWIIPGALSAVAGALLLGASRQGCPPSHSEYVAEQ